MLFRRLVLIAAVVLSAPAAAGAQDFGVMESAETINQGNFKLTVNPLFTFDDFDDQAGVAFKFGYGFTPRFDVEGKGAIYDGISFWGADFEYWLVRNQPWDVSAGAGFHVARGDELLDTTGVDLTFLTSRRVADQLDFFAALDIAVESIDDDFIDENFTTFHIVPGIEYALSDDLDFLAEVGLALNDDGAHYASFGIAYYFR